MSKPALDKRLRIGVSSCLLGIESRYDGGHMRDGYIADVLAEYFDFAPVCPELEAGMGKIREPVQLEGNLESPRLVGIKSGQDWTARMIQYSSRRLRKADLSETCGYILKSRSPSCGMERVKLYSPTGRVARKAVGLFAAALMKKYPDLPVEEEGRLGDPDLRENFIVRVFAYDRLRQLFAGRFRRSEIIAFHISHKCLLLAHHPATYRQLGWLLAATQDTSASELRQQYRHLFMTALSHRATVKKNVNVLQHIRGSLKKHISASEEADLLTVIAEYHRELVPLIVPLTLVRHHVDKHQITYIQDQVYLNPHPSELMLRNRV
ncbi:MAG: DUF523 and DUF1722 domain-containing protein [bacterium]